MSNVSQCGQAVYFDLEGACYCKSSLLLIVCLPPSWPQTAVGAKANDGGHRDGCGLYLCMDWKPSLDPGVDQAGLQRGKATTTFTWW